MRQELGFSLEPYSPWGRPGLSRLPKKGRSLNEGERMAVAATISPSYTIEVEDRRGRQKAGSVIGNKDPVSRSLAGIACDIDEDHLARCLGVYFPS